MKTDIKNKIKYNNKEHVMNGIHIPQVIRHTNLQRSKLNSITLNDNRKVIVHIHKHYTKRSRHISKLDNRKGTNSRRCVMCTTYKRMKAEENFCSNNCYNKYKEWRRQRLHDKMNAQQGDYKRWWQIWK